MAAMTAFNSASVGVGRDAAVGLPDWMTEEHSTGVSLKSKGNTCMHARSAATADSDCTAESRRCVGPVHMYSHFSL